MDIMSFRIAKETLLEKLTITHRHRAEKKIESTLTTLNQETMSIEGVAILISLTKEEPKCN